MIHKIKKSDYPGSFPPLYYFITTVKESGRLRAKALPFQFYVNPTDTDILLEFKTEWNVACDKITRAKYPEGTVFASAQLNNQVGHYSVENNIIWPVEHLDDTALDNKEKAAIITAFADYQKTAKMLMVKAKSSGGESERTQTTFIDRLKSKSSYACPTIEEDGYYIEENKWFYLVRNLRRNVPTLIVGPTGTAKTKLAFILAKKLGLPLRVHDMGSMQDPISGLLGVHRLVKGASEFDLAPFALDIQEPGILVLDEISRAPSSANNILFPCLDERKNLPLAFASSDQRRELKVHDKAFFLATANIGSQYTGTQELDAALKSRFDIIQLDYLPPTIEAELLCKTQGIDNTSASKIANIADSIRNEYNRGALSAGISTRETLSAASLFKDGFSLMDSLNLVFLPLFASSEGGGDSERGVVENIILSAL